MSSPRNIKILLVDDEKNIRQTLQATLVSWGYFAKSVASAEEALKVLNDETFDLMITDFKLEGKNGLDLIKLSKTMKDPPIFVVMTAFASFENAVNAIKEGAFDYLPKPFTNSQLEVLLKRVKVLTELKFENKDLKKKFRADYFSGMTSPSMNRLEEFVQKIAPTEANVLLIGESGTGKTELARLIHSLSNRADKTFSVVNCSTLAENLLESELFGYVKGAFTGANQDHIGKIEAANHGTLLIDEIGDLSLNGQARLLRFLQERVIERIGSNVAVNLDVRVIAATNKNLEEAVKEKEFREDLYYRLNMFECTLVPLRFRREDLPILIQRFFKEFLANSAPAENKKITETVEKMLLQHSWPGNVRELRNVIERLVILSSSREIRLEDLPESLRQPVVNKHGADDFKSLADLERSHIERVLLAEHNQERAAQILGITTVTLWRKRKEYGLP